MYIVAISTEEGVQSAGVSGERERSAPAPSLMVEPENSVALIAMLSCPPLVLMSTPATAELPLFISTVSLPAPPITVEPLRAPLAKTKRFPDASPSVERLGETIIVLAMTEGCADEIETPCAPYAMALKQSRVCGTFTATTPQK